MIPDGIALFNCRPIENNSTLLKFRRPLATKTVRTFKTYRELHGKITFYSNAIPCMRCLMTPLNRAPAFGPDRKPKPNMGLGAMSEVREALVACNVVLRLMMQQPSHITEIVPPDLPPFFPLRRLCGHRHGGRHSPVHTMDLTISLKVQIPTRR